ncbi:MAG TPA: hypothetical protein VGQ17_13690 [Gemmatimonadales bacterium]|jgi:sterol desaturase/sphingolipid hydroxylase (fatty acid hydroxylase superfamily)|nr:hypothetical protein [Gemmatimonadales bacterium]
MYEGRSDPLLPTGRFLRRLGSHTLAALGVVLASLVVGTVGYHALAGLAWIDAFLNAAMLLGGMGPVGDIPTTGGKIFAAIFALYAGLMLIGVTTLILAPVLHRILHRVHLEDPDVDESAEG